MPEHSQHDPQTRSGANSPGGEASGGEGAAPLRAVVFDLDGTLYHQRPMRARMLRELALAPLAGPRRAWRVARSLRAFRRSREVLRELGRPDEPLESLQYEHPAAELGVAAGDLREVVQEWMFERPLRHLPGCARHGLGPGLEALAARGLKLAVFSDYPVDAKLAALGVQERFTVRLDATDPEVNAFKPHPRGFELAAERLGVPPNEALYVGDRADVDVGGARAAGMPAALLGAASAPGVRTYSNMEELVDVVVAAAR